MEIEDLVCSLELSKKLLILGVNQKSLFFWISGSCPEKWWIHANEKFSKPYHPENISAFTASELMELLPACIDIKKDEPFNFYWLSMIKRCSNNIKYMFNYRCDT